MPSDFFQDDCGNKSSMRVMTFIFLMFCILTVIWVLGIWGYIAIKTMEFPKLGFSDLFGVFGGISAIGFKAVQKRYEVQEECRVPKFKRTMPEDVE